MGEYSRGLKNFPGSWSYFSRNYCTNIPFLRCYTQEIGNFIRDRQIFVDGFFLSKPYKVLADSQIGTVACLGGGLLTTYSSMVGANSRIYGK